MAEFKDARLIWELWSDTHYGGSITSITSEAGNMLKGNLQTAQPSIPWRSSSAADQVIVIDLGTPRVIRGIYLGNHNLDPSDTIQLEIASDSGFSTILLDETYDGQESIHGLGEMPLGMDGLGGFDDEGYVNPYILQWLDETVAQYARITLSGKSSGYYQAGRLALFDWFSPAGGNISWNYEMKLEQLSTNERGRSGANQANRRPVYTVVSGEWESLEENDENRLHNMYASVRKDRNVIWAGYPEAGTTNERHHTMLGFIRDYTGTRRVNALDRAGSITIEQAL